MIAVERLTKRFGPEVAVDSLSFDVAPGLVTGFLGPNGAGKTTVLRATLGLLAPTSGSVRINGRRYGEITWPLQQIGAHLDPAAMHPARSATAHLLALARSNHLPAVRARLVLREVGLEAVAHRRVGTFSLGMRQRLGVAAALLGDPAVVILDEPTNGLDPEGIAWIRCLTKDLAEAGRTVLVSGHHMSEMAQIADQLVVIGKGRLLAQSSVSDFIAEHATPRVQVVGPDLTALIEPLNRRGARLHHQDPVTLSVGGLTAREIGELAADLHVTLWELSTRPGSLEEAFIRLTARAAQYVTSGASHTDRRSR